ncbi:MAG TPA: hypothetical protein DDY68_03670 [Porphyromonadaceae bacterium]|nr:hypothetical protein [Porphyromonadaceae bacterium]
MSRRGESPLLSSRNRRIKRIFDVVVSLCVLIFIFPFIFLFCALGIKFSMPGGPIFFLQKRLGKGGKEFVLYKFRTMRVNRDCHIRETTENDERITRFGAFMRKYSLDEFPQFINVLKGEMSIVGPRPHMPSLASQYSMIFADYYDRLAVQPGITCLAQVQGFRDIVGDNSLLTMRAKYDLWYISHWSFFLDIKIIVKTFLLTLCGDRNAF